MVAGAGMGGRREGLSTVAGRAGGPARSSAETLVTGVARRGRDNPWLLFGRSAGRVREEREVQEAYRRVKDNQGAAGVDGCSLADFEKDLKNNLYRIWTTYKIT